MEKCFPGRGYTIPSRLKVKEKKGHGIYALRHQLQCDYRSHESKGVRLHNSFQRLSAKHHGRIPCVAIAEHTEDGLYTPYKN